MPKEILDGVLSGVQGVDNTAYIDSEITATRTYINEQDDLITLDKTYNNQSGTHTITADDGDIKWTLENTDFIINIKTGLSSGLRIQDDLNNPILIVPLTKFSNFGGIRSVGWNPLEDNVYDLGDFDITFGHMRWRNIRMGGNLFMKDGSFIYFDTAQNEGIKYSDDHGTLIFPEYYSAEAGIIISSNTGADGLGNWESYIRMFTDGSMIISASVGDVNDKYIRLITVDGVKLSIGISGRNAVLKADNIATTDKDFTFPNASGTFALLEVGNVFTVGQTIDQSSSSGAETVLKLDQADIDDTFIDFIGTSAVDGSRSISSDTTEDSAKFGAIKIEINGVTKWIRIYDTES